MSQEDFSYKNWTLYQNLSNEAPNQLLSDEEMTNFVTLIRQLDQKGLSIVGLLIKAYEEEKKTLSELDAKVQFEALNNGAAKFDIRNFDPKLQRIIIAFSFLHLNHGKKSKKFITKGGITIEEVD